MITWPDSLKPSVNYNVSVSTGAIRTKMDSGRIRQRRRFTISMRQIGVTWKLSDFEFGVFQSVYANLLNGGVDWFEINLPLGDGIKPYKCRFVADSYQHKYDNVMWWTVTAKLETEDQPEPFDAEITEALVTIDLDFEGFFDAVDAYHELIHTTLPALE